MSGKRPLLLRCLAGEPVERPPVWAMRQAGRWDPEFQRVRQGLSFYEFSERADLAAEASLLPRRFGVDAIILFYDITTLPVAMGQTFDLIPGRGPVPRRPITSRGMVDELAAEPDASRFGHLLDLIDRVRKDLRGELPILVFAGAPFTVASYCINTGKDLAATRRFAAEQPETWAALLAKLESATVSFLRLMLNAGGAAYQLFDTWAGGLTAAEYLQWADPGHRAILGAVTSHPSILYVKETPFVNELFSSPATVASLGTRHDLAALRQQHPLRLLQGNVSDELLRTGTADQVVVATRQCLAATGGQLHIVNLSHGMNKDTPVANFQAFVDTVRAFGLPSQCGGLRGLPAQDWWFS